MASAIQNTRVGSINGTGSALNVRTVGFRPQSVKLKNVDGLATLEWQDTMADDSGLKEVTAGTKSFLTSNGITPLSDGFTIGADADVNVSGELIHWEATERG